MKKKKGHAIDDEERQRMLDNLNDVKARISTMERLYDAGLMGGEGDSEFKNEHALEGPKKGEEVNLEESTFAFLVASRPWTGPFMTGIGVVCLKNTMFAMIIYDLFASSGGEGLEIPALVAVSVFIAQLMSSALAVLTSNDLISALMTAYHGYDTSMQTVFETGAGKFWQWALSLALSFFDGAVSLFAAFILIITSTTVLDVFLNFAAVAFIAELDENFFLLADRNLLGRNNKVAAQLIKDNAFSRPAYFVKPQTVHRLLLYTLMAFTMTASVAIFILQVNGHFASNTLYFQFGDNIRTDLGLHSGFYKLDTTLGRTREHGFIYAEERRGGAIVGYCPEKTRWTLSLGNRGDPCSEIIAESTRTRSFDIITTAEDTWFAEVSDSEVLRFLPLGDFLLIKGCDSSADCGGPGQGSCNDDNRCECEPGFSGAQCQIKDREVCSSIKLNELFGEDWPLLGRTVSSFFERIEGGSCYYHPVFLNNATQDVVFYTGLRWAISKLTEIDSAGGRVSIEKLFDPGFHALSVGQVDFVSEKVLFRSSDEGDGTPVGLNWLEGGAELKKIEDKTPLSSTVRFLCAICNNESNKCLYEGSCLDGSCDCQHGALGTLCSVTPVSDGFCDSFFNKDEFLYDGGDCCDATCSSSDGFECGIAETELEAFFFGFDSCVDPTITDSCLGGTEACYLLDETFDVTVLSRPTMWMSGNGNSIATVGILDKQIRILERNYFGWNQRGQTLEFDDEDSIEFVSFATPPASFSERRGDGKIPMAVAVSGFIDTRVFFSDTFDEGWTETVRLKLDFGLVVTKLAYLRPPLDSGSDTMLIALATSYEPDFLDGSFGYSIHTLVYSNNQFAEQWTLLDSGSGSNFALSGNGLVWAAFDSTSSNIFVFDTFDEDSSLNLFYDFPGVVQNMELDYLGEMMTVATHNAATNTTRLLRFKVSFTDFELVGESGEIEIKDYTGSFLGPGGWDSTIMSSEGRSIAIIATECPDVLSCEEEGDYKAELHAHVYTANRTEGFDFLGIFEISGLRITDFSLPYPDLALSDDGKTIAFADGGLSRFEDAALYNLGDRCAFDEAKIRTVFQYRDTVYTSTWNLVTERYFPLADMLVMDPSEAVLYFKTSFIESQDVRHTITSEEICLPLSEVNCARFSAFPSDTITDQNSTQLASIKEEVLVFVKQNETEFEYTAPEVDIDRPGASFTLGDGNCFLFQSLECPEGEQLFSMVLPTYRDIATSGEVLFGDITTRPDWSLSSDSGQLVAFRNYAFGDIPPGPAIVEERCLEPRCYTLRFSGEYGFVANSGNYTAWLNGTEVFTNQLPSSSNPHTFGECS